MFAGQQRHEVPSQNKDKGGNLYQMTWFDLNYITRWQKWRNEKAVDRTFTNIKTSAVEGVLNNNGVFSFEKTHSIVWEATGREEIQIIKLGKHVFVSKS